jgi:hypothetical protein
MSKVDRERSDGASFCGLADLGEEVRGHPSACLFVARCFSSRGVDGSLNSTKSEDHLRRSVTELFAQVNIPPSHRLYFVTRPLPLLFVVVVIVAISCCRCCFVVKVDAEYSGEIF